MNKILLLVIIILTVSCDNNNNNNNKELRNEIELIKKEELPDKKYTVTTFELDSLNGAKFFSEIKNTSNSGMKSIYITTEYSKNDSLIGTIKNGPFLNTSFLKQRIIKYRGGNENLYFLLENEDGVMIYEIKHENQALIKRQIKRNYLQWNELIVELEKETK